MTLADNQWSTTTSFREGRDAQTAPFEAGDQAQSAREQSQQGGEQTPNVGPTERNVSMAAGAVLALLGLARRDLTGLVIGALGGGLIYRGATGNCPMYSAMDINTATGGDNDQGQQQKSNRVHVVQSLLIDKPAEELYRYWRDLENLPRILSHIESVRATDERNSHWTANIKGLPMKLEWDAEITAEDASQRLAWRSLANATIAHEGEVRFDKAMGDRGTIMRASIDIMPPAGAVGRWAARWFTPALDQQIRTDLRNFKRLMETGEIPTIDGQPRGTCSRSGGKREQFDPRSSS